MKSSNNYKRLALVLSLVLALLVVFTACGGENGGEGSDDTSASTTTGSGETSGTDTPGSDETSGTNTPGSDETSGTNTPGSDETSGTNTPGSDETSGTNTPGSTETSGTGSPSGTSQPSGSTTTSTPSTPSTPSNPTDPGATTATYTVTVVNGAGEPQKSIIVKFFQNGTQVGMGSTNASGVATLKKEPGSSYTFTLEKIGAEEGQYTYDTAACVLSDAAPNVTITFDEKLTVDDSDEATFDTLMFDFDGDGVFTECKAPYLVDGTYSIEVKANEMAYFIFTPNRSGQYRFSVSSPSSNVSVGYYGAPHYMFEENGATMIGGYFELNIRAGHVGTTLDTTSKWIIGVKTTDGTATTAVLTIERFADAITDSADAEWIQMTADEKYLVQCPENDGTLTNLDITDASLADKVLLDEATGYYYYDLNGNGTIDATDAQVMMRITSASPYIDDLNTICLNTAFPCYYYDENGNFLYKELYNERIFSYAECVNEDGVVPLTTELVEAMQIAGGYMGWWDEDHPQYRLQDVEEVTEVAYLFMCCYYA